MEEYDVFISGAGPVGLFFAYQLATLGHSVYICDKKPGPIAQSRAVLMTSRTVEVLENRGIAHHLLKESVVSQGIQIHFDGKKVGTIDAINEGTSFPQLTLLAQDKAETVFVHLLESKGGTIHWNTGLKSYKQFDDHIEAVVEDPQGGEQTIRAKYIIGADGAHSMVRKVTPDWKYEGHSIATKFAIADVVLEGEDAYKLRNQRMNMFGSGQNGFCLVIPLGRDSLDGPYRYRIVVNLGPYEEEKEKKENGSSQRVTHGIAGANSFSIEELQKLLDIRLKPLNVKARDSLWTSQFRINERMADGFRRKRAFLIGDAAHCHSPAGGQGLNLGYQDADNLAWKLSLVLSGVSSDPEKLLDSYTTEREPTVKMTLQIAGGLTRLMTNSNWIMSYIIRISLGAVLSLDTVKHNAVFRLMQLNLRIQPNSPILFHNPASSLLVKTGDFLPDTNVLRRRIMHDRIERQTIRQILSGNGAKHTILWLCSRPSKYPPCPWTGIFWDKLVNLKYSDKAVRPLVVESTWHVHEYRLPEYVTTGSKDLLENAFWMEDHPDSPESLTKRLGFSDEQGTAAAIVIVRPDLYIAHTSMIRSPADIDPALSTLSSYLQTFN